MSDTRDKMRMLYISNPEVKCLRILICGPVGVGKSSFINAIDSIFQERMTGAAHVAASTSYNFTTAFQTYHIKNCDYYSTSFAFCDVSLGDSHCGGVQLEDIAKVLQGHIKEGYKFNPISPISKDDPHYNSNPELSDKIHCLVSVIPANNISMMEEAVIDKMKEVTAKSGELGIPQLVVLTKVDETCLEVKKDIKLIYRSRRIREKMQECSNRLGVPLNRIFPVKCYHEEIQLNNDVDVLLLSALENILNFANDHVAVVTPPPLPPRRQNPYISADYMYLPSVPPPDPLYDAVLPRPPTAVTLPPPRTERPAWIKEPDSTKAAQLFRTEFQNNQQQEPLKFSLSLLESEEERHRMIFSFYKMERSNWAGPLNCTLIGDPATGEGLKRQVISTVMEAVQSGFNLDEKKGKHLLFEGEIDHLTPNTSQDLLESNLFVIAGRIIGHSFLNGGPCLTGLSEAIIHILLEGDPETATISLSDCVDQEVRDVLSLLEGTKPLNENEKSVVNNISLPWDLPGVTSNNRQWLREKILLHAVLGRTKNQVKHLRKGLKDTGVWELISSRPDTAAVLFPRASDTIITSQVQKI